MLFPGDYRRNTNSIKGIGTEGKSDEISGNNIYPV